MRKVTEKSIEAFNNNANFKLSNTEVIAEDGVTKLVLFGNVIAIRDANGDLFITSCGWRSATTKERLNGLPGVSISQRKGDWYLNGNKWDGQLIQVI